MRINKNEAGIGAIGFLVTVFLGIFAAVIAIKTIPSYLENITLVSVLESLEKDVKGKDLAPNELRGLIRKRLDVNNIKTINEADIKFQKNNNTTLVSIDYEVRKNLLGNISIVMSFSNQQEVLH